MAVVIDCPSCQRKLRLPAKKLGQPLKCPACSHLFTPPTGAPATNPAETAPASLLLSIPPEPPPTATPEATVSPPEPSPSPPTDSPLASNGTAVAVVPAPPMETTLQPVYVESSWLLDTLFFRKMITPLFIQLLFWGGLLISIFGGAAGIVLGLFGSNHVDLTYVSVGMFLLLPGPILIRVGCELLLVIFFIYDTLMEIKRNTTPMVKPAEDSANPAGINPPAESPQ